MAAQLFDLNTYTQKIEDITDVESDLFKYEHTNVIVENGKVFVNSAICKVLGLRDVFAPIRMRWGRERFYNVAEIFEQAMEHATFPRRSEREREVAARNIAIIEVLMGLGA